MELKSIEEERRQAGGTGAAKSGRNEGIAGQLIYFLIRQKKKRSSDIKY